MDIKLIPRKNYIMSFCLITLTIIITLFLCNYYTEKKEYENSKNIRMKFLEQIDESNLETYLIENHDKFIYLSNSSDETIKEYEEQLKKMIITMEYEKDIIYFDTKDVDEKFYSEFKSKYFSDNLKNIEFTIVPNLLVIQNGKVTQILYTEKKELRASDLIRFVNKNMVDE